jgi:hypothetical protein
MKHPDFDTDRFVTAPNPRCTTLTRKRTNSKSKQTHKKGRLRMYEFLFERIDVQVYFFFFMILNRYAAEDEAIKAGIVKMAQVTTKQYASCLAPTKEDGVIFDRPKNIHKLPCTQTSKVQPNFMYTS